MILVLTALSRSSLNTFPVIWSKYFIENVDINEKTNFLTKHSEFSVSLCRSSRPPWLDFRVIAWRRMKMGLFTETPTFWSLRLRYSRPLDCSSLTNKSWQSRTSIALKQFFCCRRLMADRLRSRCVRRYFWQERCHNALISYAEVIHHFENPSPKLDSLPVRAEFDFSTSLIVWRPSKRYRLMITRYVYRGVAKNLMGV